MFLDEDYSLMDITALLRSYIEEDDIVSFYVNNIMTDKIVIYVFTQNQVNIIQGKETLKLEALKYRMLKKVIIQYNEKQEPRSLNIEFLTGDIVSIYGTDDFYYEKGQDFSESVQRTYKLLSSF